MTDDPGVMGNLPRSRPGRRSSKRGGGTAGSGAAPDAEVTASSAKPKAASGKSAAGRAKAKKPAAANRAPAKRTSAAGSRPAASSARTRTRAAQGKSKAGSGAGAGGAAPGQTEARQEPVTQGSTDPVTGAVLIAGRVVEGGLKVAGQIIKRIPRP